VADLKAFFLVGPTAVGKTAVAQWLAEKYRFDILSADAMLVYRGMDIGTAKPDQMDRASVHYWGLDLVSPWESFSAGKYRVYALNAIREIHAAGRQLIVTGGTGLYIKILTHGLSDLPSSNDEIRRQAEEIFKEGGIKALQDWVRRSAPQLYEQIADKENPRRLIRAVEKSLSKTTEYKNAWLHIGKGPLITGLVMPMKHLHERIAVRVNEMYAHGLIEEADRLVKQDDIEHSPTAGKAIGYEEAISYLQGKLSLANAMALTISRTRQLAKRQMTWFRHQANVEWIHIDSDMSTAEVAKKVMEQWKRIPPVLIAV
jgi:tRNA dimethylallyltransferase